jgi:TonB-dependent SusC/RagA subfamily outer membrane receptor
MKKSFLHTLLAAIIIWTGLISFNYPKLPDDFRLDYIIAQFQKYIQKYHQNKVYIQTDKNVYESGETIYLKAYVLDASKNSPEDLVKNLYVEMISPDKGIFMSRLLKIENGLAWGDFPVIDTVRTGLYLMRAYTSNMKNAGNDYLFSKEIRINHPSKIFYSKEFHKKAKQIRNVVPSIDLQFFPEGGELVDNIKTTIAFKAINQTGIGIDVNGKIFSGRGTYVCDFKSDHLGMGKFEMTPAYKQKYYAIISNDKGKEEKTNLPEVIQTGYVLNIIDNIKTFQISIKTNKTFAADPVAKTVYLIIESGGKIYSSGQHIFEKNQIELNIGKKIFPTGVVHFTLFDGQGKPQCERIAFVNNNDGLLVDASLEKNQYHTREKIEFDLEVSDKANEPLEANFSVSVHEKTDFGKDNPNIASYLLLQADLQGKIENPAYYFSNDKNAIKNVDLLMLTQGWRKFLWKDILKDSIADPKFPIETDLRITGRITKYYMNIPVKNADITLSLLNKYNDVFKTKSGKKGYYEFTGLDYSDTIDILMEVRTQLNRKNVLILVDENQDVDSKFYPFKGFYLDSLTKKQKIEYKKYVEETADPSKPKDFKLHNYADQVIKFNDQMRSSGQNVMDILKSRVPGLSVSQNSSMIRGPSSILLSNEPLYLLDGIPVDFSTVQSLSVFDVESVEILKGPSASIYGMHGSNGVIAIYTKKGFYMTRGEIRFKMLGYHTPKKFYSPKYTNNNVQGNPDNRKTIFWDPSVKTDSKGQAHIEFYHSDIPGEFEIVIEGMDNQGRIGVFTTSYLVK